MRVELGRHDSGGVQVRWLEFRELPFQARRVFYVVGVTTDWRGKHAHEDCDQLLVCVQGTVDLFLEDLEGVRQARLGEGEGYYLPRGTWIEYRSPYELTTATILVVASKVYSEPMGRVQFAEYLREGLADGGD